MQILVKPEALKGVEGILNVQDYMCALKARPKDVNVVQAISSAIGYSTKLFIRPRIGWCFSETSKIHNTQNSKVNSK